MIQNIAAQNIQHRFSMAAASSSIAFFAAPFLFAVVLQGIVIFISAPPEVIPIILLTSILTVAAFVYLFVYRMRRIECWFTNDTMIVRDVLVKKKILFDQISEVKEQKVPMSSRLFQISPGFRAVPGVGMAWISLGVGSTGVMISTKDKQHIIVSPENKEMFMSFIQTIIRKNNQY